MALRDAVIVVVVLAARALPASAQGLEVVSGGPVRIEVAHVDATIEEGVAKVDVDETFRNGSAQVQEGVWRFNLPEDAVIGSFSMWMEGREKRGRVMEAGTARAVYDSIVRRKRDPGLLEQVGWREFAVNVYPIPAHETVRVRLVYSHLVRDDLGLQTLEIPLPQGCGAVGDLRVHVTVDALHGLSGVDCPSHRGAKLEVAANRAEASFSGDGVEPTGPFVLRSVVRRDGFDVTLLADRAAGAADGWFVARIVPKLAAPPSIARDVVFVVDRSGSMEGRKMEQARAALLAGLRTLKPGDRFDVVSFSSDVTSMGAGHLVDVNDGNLARASRVAADLSASGGTAIGDALAAALALKDGDAQRLFTVVFLTDGDPTVGETDPAAILASFRKSAGATRLFAFGVGSDVKDFLLTKLAVEGRGEARYVREDENLEVPLAALFDRVRTPLLLDPVVEVEGEGIEVTDREPRRLPDLFQGRPLVISGRFKGSGTALFHLRGRSGADDVKVDVPVEFPLSTPARPHVAQIWAKARVERLLDDLRALGPNAELKREVLSLGLAHQLVTPLTSFLVVEEGVKLADSVAPADRSGAAAADDGSAFNGDPTSSADLPTGATGGTSIGVGHMSNGIAAFSSRRAGGGGKGGGGLGMGGSAGAALSRSESAALAALDWLARHQSADGHWDAREFAAQCHGDRCDGGGEAGYETAATGLALLALLGAGDSHQSGTHSTAVKNGLLYLRSLQDVEGCIGRRDAPHFLRQHAIAALALVDDYGRTASPAFQAPSERAIRFALSARSPQGAWNFADGALDVETSAWMVLLLRTAKMARLDVDAQTLTDAAAAFDPLIEAASGRVVVPKRADGGALQDETVTAIAILVRIFAGHTVKDDPFLLQAADRLLKEPPTWDPATGRVDAVYWNFGSLAMFQLGGARFDRWNEAVKTATLGHQRIDATSDAFGSWDPLGTRATELGRVGATAMNALTQEVYYRYPRVFGMKFR